jgi:ketosteroid isomerase-like protein
VPALAENVELVKGVLTGFGSGDSEAIRGALPALVSQFCTPDIEFVETPERVDARTFRGHDGVLEAFNRWFDLWEEYDFEPVSFEDHGDDVFVVADERARGHSGASVGARLFQIFTFRDGKVCRYREFYDEDAARAALRA